MATKKTTKKPAHKTFPSKKAKVEDQSKRDFVVTTSCAIGAIGACATAVPMVSSMSPSADVLAQASVEVKLDGIEPGQQKKVMWRGKPVFVRRRTEEEIAAAKAEDNQDMKDPQVDADRVKVGKEEWLVMIGVCTHLGCIPVNDKGDFDGWFCPCHGSHYDISGRIRKGPARTNLVVPPYEFLNDSTIKIG